MPKKAKGSLPTIIKPINTSLKTDRKDAMCLSKEKKKKIIRSHNFQPILKFSNSSVCKDFLDTKSKSYL